MKKQAGLWIDHRKAVIVMISEAGEEIKEIPSEAEKHVRFSGGTASEDGLTEDIRERQFEGHLNNYYDQVIAIIRQAESILIFGPGEAKHELQKRLARAGLIECIRAIETVDKLTNRQVAAKVREAFPSTTSG
jgi:hypothetical protein